MGITSTPMEISSKCVSLTYASLSKQLYYDLQCSIIHESFQNLVLLCSCSHCFCKAYIQAWLDRDKTCPTNCPLFISDVIQYYICQLALINCISSKEDLAGDYSNSEFQKISTFPIPSLLVLRIWFMWISMMRIYWILISLMLICIIL